MPDARRAIADAAAQLQAVSPSARLDAELLMAHALGIGREALLLYHLGDPAPTGFAALVSRRLDHEPVAYIVGSRAFWTIELAVGPGALVPRPDSETLIEAAIDHFGARAPATILDLGTGPGTLLLAALAQWPQARGLGIDRSPAALGYARANAETLGLERRARFAIADWGAAIGERFDLVLANPPYVREGDKLPADVQCEPAGALFAGVDGLDAYRVIVPQLPRLLAPGGVAAIEIGQGQAAAVESLIAAAGLASARRADLAGIVRCLSAMPGAR